MGTESDYGFYRTEIRTMQIQCNGDNEKFLQMVATLVGKLSEKVDKLQHDKGMLEHRISIMEQ